MGSEHIFLRIRKIKAISSFCSLRCAFCFPMAASCCLLLSPLYHCLDSLRPPQEGKVDIYVEAFGLTISRRSFCPNSGRLPLIQTFIHSALGKKQTGSGSGCQTGEAFSFVSHKRRQAASQKCSTNTHFPQNSIRLLLFFSDRSGKMFHLRLALECVPVIANCRSRSLLLPDWLRM